MSLPDTQALVFLSLLAQLPLLVQDFTSVKLSYLQDAFNFVKPVAQLAILMPKRFILRFSKL